MFGISCAPAMYNRILKQVLDKCDGVDRIFDDIVVHGSSQEEHDSRVHEVVSVLQERGFTLNYGKCQFNLQKIAFMGHVLSEKGIGLSDTKAIVNARQPETASEVRSFLGLVNFAERFISDLATLSEPLWKLTRNEHFASESEQESAFQKWVLRHT